MHLDIDRLTLRQPSPMMAPCRCMGSLRPISSRRMHGLRPIACRGIHPIGLPTALGGMIEAAALKPFRQVALIYPARRIIVRVFVRAILLRARTVPVAKVIRDIALRPVSHFRQGRIDARLARVAFRREGYISGRLRQVDAAFGIPDDLR